MKNQINLLVWDKGIMILLFKSTRSSLKVVKLVFVAEHKLE